MDALRERAARRPAHEALVVDRVGEAPLRITYGELVARMDDRAAALRDRGVREAERCGLVARQGAPFVIEALAVLAAGGCLVPIPDDHRGAVLEDFCARAHLHHLAVEHAGEPGGFAWRALPEPPPVDGQGEAAFRALRPAYLRFTSGTTSRRKGVILGHAAIQARLDAANRGLAIGPADRVLWLLPMAHHFVVSILLYLREGAAILLPAGSLARPVLSLAERERASVLYASPYHHQLLARDRSDAGLDTLRLAVSTADGLSRDVAAAFRARFGKPLCQALGIIEVGLPVMNLARAEAKPTALGRPLPDYQVWLRGDDGRPAADPTAPERSGEICIRGRGLFDAYLAPWTPARQVLEPDGFRTGDQGYWDADGDLHLAGRRTNRIHMAGMKFFGEEVEAVLDGHPRVRRSRVSARPHPHLGEIPVAEIELAHGAEVPPARELAAFCRERLPLYKVPREFRVVEALPTTATGKIERAPDFSGPR